MNMINPVMLNLLKKNSVQNSRAPSLFKTPFRVPNSLLLIYALLFYHFYFENLPNIFYQ